MKYISSIFFAILFLTNVALANERTTKFEGFDAKIVSIVDDMSDEKSGVIFFYFNPIYIAVYGHDDFRIWANVDDLNFAFDSDHLIRVGKNKPFLLKGLSKRNNLTPINKVEAESVIQSLVNGEVLKLRYYDWPRHNKVDMKLQSSTAGFIYYQAAKLFGWKDFGESHRLPPATLQVYAPKKTEDKGYATVSVDGNSNLGINKNFDKYGGGAVIRVGRVQGGFGLHKGRWICKSVERSGNKHLIIRDLNGNIVFKEILPSHYENVITGETWPVGKIAARKAWKNAPLGTIEIEGKYRKKVFLYGFRELWKWGMQNADFPPIE